MKRDKAFLEVGGQLVIERILARVKPLTDDLWLITNSPEKYRQFGHRSVPDIYPHRGALGGIYTALNAARYDYVLVVACDMPFLQVELLRHLLHLAPTAEAIIPLMEPSRPETLHAVYSQRCLPAIQTCLQARRLRVTDFFDDVSVRHVKRDEIAKFDPQFHSFININTPAEWRQAQALAAKLPQI